MTWPVTHFRPWMIVVALIAVWAIAQFVFPPQQFRSCVGGICDAFNSDSPPAESLSK